MLLNTYFTIERKKHEGEQHEYSIQLLANHEVYKGHFPGNPVSPGVCQIQTIRECCEDALGKELRILSISQCRFLQLLTPECGQELTLRFGLVEADNETCTYKVDATLLSNEATFVTMKAQLAAKQ